LKDSEIDVDPSDCVELSEFNDTSVVDEPRVRHVEVKTESVDKMNIALIELWHEISEQIGENPNMMDRKCCADTSSKVSLLKFLMEVGGWSTVRY